MRSYQSRMIDARRRVAVSRLCLAIARAGLVGGAVIAAWRGAHWLLIGAAVWFVFSLARPGPMADD